jgi:hypothetical protein
MVIGVVNLSDGARAVRDVAPSSAVALLTSFVEGHRSVIRDDAHHVCSALDLLIWNGAVKWEQPVSSSR